MMYDLVIIGAGPGGYVAAIRAGQTGMKTALIDRDHVGGMCLNWGCIPTKALIESGRIYQRVKDAASFGVAGINKKNLSFDYATAAARARRIVQRLTRGVEFLLEKNGVDMITGEAVIPAPGTVSVNNRLLETKHIIIATGSRPALPDGSAEEGWTELTELLDLTGIPDRVVVAGSGPHAIEVAQMFRMMDRQVTLVCPEKQLATELDPYLEAFIQKRLKRLKVKVMLNSVVTAITTSHVVVNGEHIPAELAIHAHRRTGVVPEAPENLDVSNGFVTVSDDFETSIPDVFAVGDVNGRSALAHAASAEALHVVDILQGIRKEFRFDRIPLNVYSSPEMAQLGPSLQDLESRGIEVKVSEFPLSANGKAMTEGQTEGFVRVLSETTYGEVLGVQIVADHATDMIAEAGALMEIEGTVFDLARVVHAHPTVSEVFMEAGFEAMGRAIHK